MDNSRGPLVDRISNLPDPVIHHIMSFLPTKDATRSCTLSKRWVDLWCSFPILNFDEDIFDDALPEALSDVEKRDLFFNHLQNSIRRRQERSVSIEKFRFRALSWAKFDFARIDWAIKLALELSVERLDLDFFSNENDFYDLPACLYSAKSVTCFKLKGFKVGIRELFSGCPSMEELILEKCVVNVKASSAKLRTLVLHGCNEIQTVELDTCNLRSFCYFGKASQFVMANNLNLNTCKNLTELALKEAIVPDQWLKDHISSLVHLENLILDRCLELKTTNIFHENLRSLSLVVCTEMVVKIDCPKLCSFIYEGKIIRFGLFNSSGSLNATLKLSRGNTIGWFIQLWRLLGLFDHCKILRLVCNNYEDLIFREDLRDDLIPPLHDLKHLKMECTRIDYTKLVENLLWLSPHLEILCIARKDEESYIKFQFERIPVEDREDFFCCEAHPKECWQHCLKKIIIKDSGDITLQAKKRLLKYFTENAKVLELVEENSKTFNVVEGEYDVQ